MELNMKELYERALSFASLKHAGQLRKDGKPYITHPEKVAGDFDYSAEKVVAILHDVLEDTDATEDELRAIGCTEEIIAALKLLTHQKGVKYMDYVKAAAENPIARAVKLADLRHNLGSIDAIRSLRCAKHLEARYREAMAYIKSLDDNLPE
jgi:(p)ppGpp synthase/HD superfamily hydrolase